MAAKSRCSLPFGVGPRIYQPCPLHSGCYGRKNQMGLRPEQHLLNLDQRLSRPARVTPVVVLLCASQPLGSEHRIWLRWHIRTVPLQLLSVVLALTLA